MSSRAAIQMRPGAGPHNLHKKEAEKIKDFKGTVKRLVGYLIEKKASILIVFKYFFNILSKYSNAKNSAKSFSKNKKRFIY